MSNPSLRRYHMLVKQAGLTEDERLAMLQGLGVESSKDLTAAQLNDLCDALQRDMDNRHNAPLPVRRLRSKVLDLLTSMGIYVAGGGWDRVNSFLAQPRIAGKRLYILNEAELKALVAKLSAMLRKRQKEQEATENQTRWN